jgi:hypothetical protein
VALEEVEPVVVAVAEVEGVEVVVLVFEALLDWLNAAVNVNDCVPELQELIVLDIVAVTDGEDEIDGQLEGVSAWLLLKNITLKNNERRVKDSGIPNTYFPTYILQCMYTVTAFTDSEVRGRCANEIPLAQLASKERAL